MMLFLGFEDRLGAGCDEVMNGVGVGAIELREMEERASGLTEGGWVMRHGSPEASRAREPRMGVMILGLSEKRSVHQPDTEIAGLGEKITG